VRGATRQLLDALAAAGALNLQVVNQIAELWKKPRPSPNRSPAARLLRGHKALGRQPCIEPYRLQVESRHINDMRWIRWDGTVLPR
jgi:hypothetical protein